MKQPVVENEIRKIIFSVYDEDVYKRQAQWGMQAVNNAYQKTSNAISKAIKKNKVKLKYGTFVYLVNGRENRN